LYGSEQISEYDVGTDKPGFQVEWDLNNKWTKQNLIPIISNYSSDSSSNEFASLNDEYHFDTIAENDLKLKLVVRISPSLHDKDADLAKDKIIYVNKFSIPRWDGNLYLNFNLPGIDRSESNVEIRRYYN
jgi:hypothetical protein